MNPSLADGEWSGLDIESLRGARNRVSIDAPSAFFLELEATAGGAVEPVATIFLVNRECPFRCLYCDLWKNTTTERVPIGAIPRQIDHALTRLGPARHIKLYNSGNFFDRQAIPLADHPAIARRCAAFRTVIVENHPRLVNRDCLAFRDLLRREREAFRQSGEIVADIGADFEFEIAMGLETVHPQVLPRLNKQMSTTDFQRSAEILGSAGIEVRAFILLQPPYMPSGAAVEWALRSLEFAFACGARVATVIPTRGGNGTLEVLAQRGEFQPPRVGDLELVLETAIGWRQGRVFVDLWDVERFYDCLRCGPARRARLHAMNLGQTVLPAVSCDH